MYIVNNPTMRNDLIGARNARGTGGTGKVPRPEICESTSTASSQIAALRLRQTVWRPADPCGSPLGASVIACTPGNCWLAPSRLPWQAAEVAGLVDEAEAGAGHRQSTLEVLLIAI